VVAAIGPVEGNRGASNVVVAIALNHDTSNTALATNPLQANTFPGLNMAVPR
jgi:hypothetical protein